MARGAAGGRKASLETLEQDEGSEGDGGMQLGAVEGIGDEMGEFGLRMGRGGGVLGAGEEVGDEPGAETGSWLVTVEGICAGGGLGRSLFWGEGGELGG